MKTLKYQVKKICLVSLLLLADPMLSLDGLADSAPSGGDTSGGGASVCVVTKNNEGIPQDNCDQLLDTYLKNSHTDITKLEAFKRFLEPKLQELERLVPDFAAELRESLEKDWYISDLKQKIPNLGEANGTDLPIQQRAVQYQNKKEIWINKEWFTSRPLEEQADLLLHEMVMHIRLKSIEAKKHYGDANSPVSLQMDEVNFRAFGSSPNVDAVRKIVAYISGNEPLQANRLQGKLYDLFLGHYLTANQKLSFEEIKKKYLKKMVAACSLPDDGHSADTQRTRAVGSVLQELDQLQAGFWNNNPITRARSGEVAGKQAQMFAVMNFASSVAKGNDFGFRGYTPTGSSNYIFALQIRYMRGYDLKTGSETIIADREEFMSTESCQLGCISDHPTMEGVCNYARESLEDMQNDEDESASPSRAVVTDRVEAKRATQPARDLASPSPAASPSAVEDVR